MTAFTFRDLAFVGGRRLLYPTYVQDYLDRVTAADVAAGNTLGLELGVTDAFNICLQNMVADTSLGVSGGVLAQAASLIKASCAMQGARTLSGALVPLAADMPAPTNFNFVSGDYNRRTGLGNAANTSKYLNPNRNNNADTQNSKHLAVYVAVAGSGSRSLLAGNTDSWLAFDSTNFYARVNQSNSVIIPTGAVTGFIGASRSASTAVVARISGANTSSSISSISPANESMSVFRKPDNSQYARERLNFYSIGSALDLAILDARITALSNAIQAAIAP